MESAFCYIAVQALSSIAFDLALEERLRFLIVVLSFAHVVLLVGLLVGYRMIARAST